MLAFPAGLRIYLAIEPVDMRKQYDGLWTVAQQKLKEDPRGGAVFVFTNGDRNRIKLLHWDGTGVWVMAKRLEKGRFVWPPIVDGAMTLTPAQLAVLIEAMDWRRTVAPPAPIRPVLV